MWARKPTSFQAVCVDPSHPALKIEDSRASWLRPGGHGAPEPVCWVLPPSSLRSTLALDCVLCTDPPCRTLGLLGAMDSCCHMAEKPSNASSITTGAQGIRSGTWDPLGDVSSDRGRGTAQLAVSAPIRSLPPISVSRVDGDLCVALIGHSPSLPRPPAPTGHLDVRRAACGACTRLGGALEYSWAGAGAGCWSPRRSELGRAEEPLKQMLGTDRDAV